MCGMTRSAYGRSATTSGISNVLLQDELGNDGCGLAGPKNAEYRILKSCFVFAASTEVEGRSMPSATIEEYLEAIYKLAEKGPVRPGQVAEAMGVSAPTVTATLGRLQVAGLVDRPDGGVELTLSGRRGALDLSLIHI